MHYYHEAQQLARAYIPFQEFRELYSPECALTHGTVFPELSKPYEIEYADYGNCKE